MAIIDIDGSFKNDNGLIDIQFTTNRRFQPYNLLRLSVGSVADKEIGLDLVQIIYDGYAPEQILLLINNYLSSFNIFPDDYNIKLNGDMTCNIDMAFSGEVISFPIQ